MIDNLFHLAFLRNFGWGELVLIFGLFLLLFGAKRLPEIARAIGKSIKRLQRT